MTRPISWVLHGRTVITEASGSDRVQKGGPAQIEDAAAALQIRADDAKVDPVWDALVEATPGGDLAQTTLWASTRQRLGIRVRHFCMYASDGALLGGCLIQYRQILPKVWIGAVPRGPLLFVEKPFLALRLIQEMLLAARRAGICLLVVQPPEGASEALQGAMESAGFRLGGPPLAPDATVRIDLRRPEEEVFSSVHSRKRTHIRKAMRSGLECRNSSDVDTFHRLHLASADRLGFPPIQLGNLKAQWDVLAPKGMCHLVEVRYGDRPIVGEWLTRFGDTVTGKLYGHDVHGILGSPVSQVAGAASRWASILWAKSTGASYFDFGGFDRKAAEAILRGDPLPASVASSSQIKWSFGGEVLLLPRSQFAFTNPLMQRALGGLLPPLLTSQAVRRLGQRIRTRRPDKVSQDMTGSPAAMANAEPQTGRAMRSARSRKDVFARRLLTSPYWLVKVPHERFCDWHLGIETDDRHIFQALQRPRDRLAGLGHPFRSIPYGIAYWVMRHIRPTSTDGLLDLGCGAGRLICVAAQFVFSRITGVESNPGLVSLAVENVNALRRCTMRPEVVRADVAGFQVPDDVNLIWMFNPFHGDTLRSALIRITESYDRRPRRLQLLYYNPEEHAIMVSVDRIRQTETHCWWPRADNTWFRRLNVYEVVAP